MIQSFKSLKNVGFKYFKLNFPLASAFVWQIQVIELKQYFHLLMRLHFEHIQFSFDSGLASIVLTQI